MSTYAVRSKSAAALGGAAASAPGKKPDQHIAKNRDSARLINVLVKLKEKFLARDGALTRPEKGAKMHNVFWELAATEFIKMELDLDMDCFHVRCEDHDLPFWFDLGLS